MNLVLEPSVDKLIDIFDRLFSNGSLFVQDISLREENLLGYKLHMRPRDLLYLFFEIEKVFHISIPQEAISNRQFTSFNKILGIINAFDQQDISN